MENLSLGRSRAMYQSGRCATSSGSSIRWKGWLSQLRGPIVTVTKPMKTRGSHANLTTMRRNRMALRELMVLRRSLASIALLRRRWPMDPPLPARGAPDRKFYARRGFQLTFVTSQRAPGGFIQSILVEVERRGSSGASLYPDVAPFWYFLCFRPESPHLQYLTSMLPESSFISPSSVEPSLRGPVNSFKTIGAMRSGRDHKYIM